MKPGRGTLTGTGAGTDFTRSASGVIANFHAERVED